MEKSCSGQSPVKASSVSGQSPVKAGSVSGQSPVKASFSDVGASINTDTPTASEKIIMQALYEISRSVQDLSARLGPALKDETGQVQGLGQQLREMKTEIFARLDVNILSEEIFARLDVNVLDKPPFEPVLDSAPSQPYIDQLPVTDSNNFKSSRNGRSDTSCQSTLENKNIATPYAALILEGKQTTAGDGDNDILQRSTADSSSTPLLPEQTRRRSSRKATPPRARNKKGGMPEHLSQLSKRGADSRMDSLFPQVEDLKNSVFDALNEKVYNVEALYKDTGPFQALARSAFFQNFVLIIIGINTVWIAIETDYNKTNILSDADTVFQVMDNAFCLVFFIEIVVRFGAFRKTVDALRDAWFVFDLLLVCMMVWETWIMVAFYQISGGAQIQISGGAASHDGPDPRIFRMLRLIRLVRVARAARILQSAPELETLLSGMVAGMRSVMAVVSLMALVIYVFGVTFTELLSKNSDGAAHIFESVPGSMHTLMLQVICGPDITIMAHLLASGGMYYFIFLLFLFISNFTLLNMLIGILCDVVSSTSMEAKESVFQKEVEAQIQRLAAVLDTDGDGTISQYEFEIMINDAEMTSSFHALGVDVVAIAHFAKFIFEQSPYIPYADFAALVGQFRGSKAATIKDLMDVRRYMTVELLGFEHRLSSAEQKAIL